MYFRRLLSAVACASALLSIAKADTPNLLVNGSFESETTSSGTVGSTVSNKITGWSAQSRTGAASSVWVTTGPGLNEPQPADGNNLLSLGGFNTARGVIDLWQDFTTTPGQTYDVSVFFGRSNNSTNVDNVSFNASTFDIVTGSVNGGALSTFSSPNAAATGTTGIMEQATFQFTAVGTTTRLLLQDMSASTGPSLHLDNISVTTAVPEPATYAALLGGAALLATGWQRRRRAR